MNVLIMTVSLQKVGHLIAGKNCHKQAMTINLRNSLERKTIIFRYIFGSIKNIKRNNLFSTFFGKPLHTIYL